MTKQHLVMLAYPFKEGKYGIGGWFASEKLDGHRCLWIPGTRGLLKKNIPFANLYDVKRHEQVCSGLWSRLGNVIVAPEEWLDNLPLTFLDGELWLRRGRAARQEVASIIKKLEPEESDWDRIQFCCFDMPSPERFFRDREVDFSQKYSRKIRGALTWWEGLNIELVYRPKATTPFQSTVILLRKYCKGRAIAHKQFQLVFQTSLALDQVKIMAEKISLLEGEGLIIRDGNSRWTSERSHKMLKIKKLEDAEAIVLGYTTGKKTDKGSKLLGLMGALILSFKGRRFELSGFTDYERRLDWTQNECRAEASCTPREWAEEHPGEEVPFWIEAFEFPRGSKVTFQYRDLTRDELPNEARYWRKDVHV